METKTKKENKKGEIINLTNEEKWIIRYTLKEIQKIKRIITDKNENIIITERGENIIKLQLLYTNEELELMNEILTKIKYK